MAPKALGGVRKYLAFKNITIFWVYCSSRIFLHATILLHPFRVLFMGFVGYFCAEISLRAVAKSLHVHGFVVLEYAGEGLGGILLVGVVFT